MTCPFSAKLIVSVVTFIHFSSGVRMLRAENYLMKNDNLLKDKKDDATTPATPDIGGFPFPNRPSFKIPGFNIPGIGGSDGDNNPFGIPIPGVPDISNPGTGVPDIANPGTGVPDIANPGTGVPDASVPDPGVPDVAVPDAGVSDAAVPPPTPAP